VRVVVCLIFLFWYVLRRFLRVKNWRAPAGHSWWSLESLVMHALTLCANHAVLFPPMQIRCIKNCEQCHGNVPSLFTGVVDSLESTTPSHFCAGKCSFRFWTVFVPLVLVFQSLFLFCSFCVFVVCYIFSYVIFCTSAKGTSL
jgi:hypothetical protein